MTSEVKEVQRTSFVSHSTQDPVAGEFEEILLEKRRTQNRASLARDYDKVTSDDHDPSSKQHRPALLARDLMSGGTVSVNDEQTINDAIDIMREHEIHHLPVINSFGTLVGILSDRDILTEVELTPSKQVHELMSDDVITAAEDTSVREIARIMLERRFHSVPILDENEKLIGIITTTDLLRGLWNHAPVELWA